MGRGRAAPGGAGRCSGRSSREGEEEGHEPQAYERDLIEALRVKLLGPDDAHLEEDCGKKLMRGVAAEPPRRSGEAEPNSAQVMHRVPSDPEGSARWELRARKLTRATHP